MHVGTRFIALGPVAFAALSVVALSLGGAVGQADSATLLSQWLGHGRSMQLAPDHTGTFTQSSGAGNSETWGVSWTGDPNRSGNITLKSLTSRIGNPLHNVGDRYQAQLQSSGGHTVLNMQPAGDPSSSFLFCTLEVQSGPNSPCGA